MADAKGWLAAVGAFLAALVASSHHTLHMLLLSLGVGVGFSALLFNTGARRAMIVVSLAMTALTVAWSMRRPHRSTAQMAALAVSVAASIGLLAYTVILHGW